MKKAPLALLAAALSFPASADDALGTLTVNGKTTILKAVAATEETDGDGEKWLVILASDRKVEGDRSIARLAALAKDGRLHAVRILWQIGYDTVRAVPYDPNLAASGRMGQEHPTLDLKKYGSGRVDAEFRSKMVGQSWHFHARVKAAVAAGGALELEPEAEEVGATVTGGDPKLVLGKLGFAYDEESFAHAIADANLEAVRLFLETGMSPNAHGKSGTHPMLLAAMVCGDQANGKPRSEILEALVLARGDVKAKDHSGSTALLWAVQLGCSPSSVQALLKAGADPNVRARGGATPLMFAELFKRTEIEAMLKKAGAKKPAP